VLKFRILRRIAFCCAGGAPRWLDWISVRTPWRSSMPKVIVSIGFGVNTPIVPSKPG